jgi:hypothetical protein
VIKEGKRLAQKGVEIGKKAVEKALEIRERLMPPQKD